MTTSTYPGPAALKSGVDPFAIWNGHHTSWPQAEVIADPIAIHRKGASTEPRLLVRRRENKICGPHGEQLVYLDGEPTISLFTGAGGMDIGLESAGFCTVLQHEWSEGACQTLIANRPEYFRYAALIQGDLRKTPTQMILHEAGLRVGEAAMVCGGPPCQGFSRANKHASKGRFDLRNDLVFEYLRVVRETMPKFFLMENVPGFVQFNDHEYLKAFLEEAYGSFYELVYGLADAVTYGVPQYRCRFICIGTRRDLGVIAAFPGMTHFDDRDLLVTNPSDLFPHRPCDNMPVPGIRYFPDRPVLIPPPPVSHDGVSKGRISTRFIEFYQRLQREEPDRIVTTPQNRRPHNGR